MKKHLAVANVLYLGLIVSTLVLSNCKGDGSDTPLIEKDSTRTQGFGGTRDEGIHGTSYSDTALRRGDDTLGSVKGKSDKDTLGAAQ